ncbi:B-4DMT family transporter [Amycolatopsis sp. Poz14]|uniref:B-4DMT family transporter n=1 Tax=Amycolatopsis sp. Poz14 TaxID=1447705 RepID=UPI001EE7DBD6|nr:B-4DMT family transporter [Amycolatopsis sp. Poz14]MCG3755950.1 B-4DMT family transporter [Amycolatopsis sp. Poz14]
MLGAWLTRGLVMAVVHAAAMTLLAKWSVFHPTGQTLFTSLAIAVLVGVAALWSAIDGWCGLRDRGRAWFIASLVAGVCSGILYVIGRAIFVDQTGVSELGAALTGGAAFSALLVLVPAGLGLFVGGRIRRPAEDADADSEPEPDDEDEDGTGSRSGELELPPSPAPREEKPPAEKPKPSPVSRQAANRARRRPTVAGRSPAPRNR